MQLDIDKITDIIDTISRLSKSALTIMSTLFALSLLDEAFLST